MSLQRTTTEAILQARITHTDSRSIEIKSGSDGAPKTISETISAFANGEGGLIILGIDERQGFTAATIKPTQLADAMATACAEQVEPPIRADIEIVEFEGSMVVAAAIPALERAKKPCYVTTQGLERGSYIRGHDGDRHLSTYEVHALLTGRGQPRDDSAPVEGASRKDLQEREVEAYVRRLTNTRGHIFADHTTEQILTMTGVLTPDSSGVTLAGLLAFGRFPQQFLPQMNVTFAAFPTVDGSPMADGTRFLDNAAIDGSIPQMVEWAWSALSRNTIRRAVVEGMGREDTWEYPPRVVRELVANALMHRDYHPLAQGSQVRLELYPDRLEVISPGGLFGVINAEILQEANVTSTRNLLLARLLEDVALGLRVVASELKRAGLPPLEIRTNLLHFTAIIRRTNLAPSSASASTRKYAPTRRQSEVVSLLASGPRSTVDLARAMRLTRNAVLGHLKSLEAVGQVRLTTKSRRAPDAKWEMADSDTSA